MILTKVLKGKRVFSVYFRVYFFDNRRTAINNIILTEAFHQVDALIDFEKYLEFIFQDEKILPGFEFFNIKEIYEI